MAKQRSVLRPLNTINFWDPQPRESTLPCWLWVMTVTFALACAWLLVRGLDLL